MLVETVRIDGKPHQRYLAYLGSLQADRRDRPRFWYDVTRKLDQCRLSREERKRIKSTIAKKIGGKVPVKGDRPIHICFKTGFVILVNGEINLATVQVAGSGSLRFCSVYSHPDAVHRFGSIFR